MTDAAEQAGAFWRYRRPAGPGVVLPVAPVLASWDRSDQPSQVALAGFLDRLEPIVGPALASSASPLALALEVGLPTGTPLSSGGRDLDNYLFPIVQRFGPARFAAVFARKHHQRSAITIGPAVPGNTDPAKGGWSRFAAWLTGSSQTVVWKQQLADALAATGPVVVEEGPVALHVAFRVSAQRNWASLWKPTIDALGGILGLDKPDQPFHPRDDRIVDLGLQHAIDPSIGHAVGVAVWWKPADP